MQVFPHGCPVVQYLHQVLPGCDGGVYAGMTTGSDVDVAVFFGVGDLVETASTIVAVEVGVRAITGKISIEPKTLTTVTETQPILFASG